MSNGSVTHLLHAWKTGDRSVEGDLIALIYPTLQDLARGQLRRFPGTRTLQATELVHEAFERLQRQQQVDWQDRRHFFAIAATVIRRLLVDHLRQKRSQKRGNDVVLLDVDIEGVSQACAEVSTLDWLALDQSLNALREIDPDCVRVVEMRVFAGLTVEEVAASMDTSTATVGRQWRFARAWLADRLAS